MSKIVTAQELMDCKVDADTFGEAANGAPGVQVKSRLGRVYWTLATYDKRFNDRAVLFDKMYVDYNNLLNSKVLEFDDSRNAQVKKYDDALAIKVKAFDDSLVKKNKEFDDSRNAQVTKYDNTLATKTKAFDDSLVKKNKEFDDARNAQVTKYNQTMDAKVVEYDLKINGVDAALREATENANAAKTTADAAKVSADNATNAVGGKLDKTAVNNTLTSTDKGQALSAAMGKQLNDTKVKHEVLTTAFDANLTNKTGIYLINTLTGSNMPGKLWGVLKVWSNELTGSNFRVYQEFTPDTSSATYKRSWNSVIWSKWDEIPIKGYSIWNDSSYIATPVKMNTIYTNTEKFAILLYPSFYYTGGGGGNYIRLNGGNTTGGYDSSHYPTLVPVGWTYEFKESGSGINTCTIVKANIT